MELPNSNTERVTNRRRLNKVFMAGAGWVLSIMHANPFEAGTIGGVLCNRWFSGTGFGGTLESAGGPAHSRTLSRQCYLPSALVISAATCWARYSLPAAE